METNADEDRYEGGDIVIWQTTLGLCQVFFMKIPQKN